MFAVWRHATVSHYLSLAYYLTCLLLFWVNKRLCNRHNTNQSKLNSAGFNLNDFIDWLRYLWIVFSRSKFSNSFLTTSNLNRLIFSSGPSVESLLWASPFLFVLLSNDAALPVSRLSSLLDVVSREREVAVPLPSLSPFNAFWNNVAVISVASNLSRL